MVEPLYSDQLLFVQPLFSDHLKIHQGWSLDRGLNVVYYKNTVDFKLDKITNVPHDKKKEQMYTPVSKTLSVGDLKSEN